MFYALCLFLILCFPVIKKYYARICWTKYFVWIVNAKILMFFLLFSLRAPDAAQGPIFFECRRYDQADEQTAET